MKTEYTMAQLRAICADLGIRPAVSLKGTMARIEEAKAKQAVAQYRDAYPEITQIINAEPRKVGKVRELGMGYQGRRRKESAWIKRLMNTTALYAHQPFPGPTVTAIVQTDFPFRWSSRLMRAVRQVGDGRLVVAA